MISPGVTGRPVWQQKGADSPAAPTPRETTPEAARPAALRSGAEETAQNSAKMAPEEPAKTRKITPKKMFLAGVAIAALIAGGWYGNYYVTTGRYLVSTDDAYVGAKNTTLSAKVSGYVSFVMVEDNAQVHAGDIIAKIDDGDYVLAVESARGKVATQKATVERIGKQVDRAGRRDRPGQGAARLGAGRRDARRPRARAPAVLGRRATSPASRRSRPRRRTSCRPPPP